MKGDSRITLDPGIYVINNGKFEVQDSSVIEGDGVTIILL